MPPDVAVAIVGGGPAGAVLAARLARRGIETLVLERAPAWRWRAGGVFASPAAMAALRGAEVEPGTLARVARPIPAMLLETPAGTTVRLDYGADAGGDPAVGFDRSALDPALLAMAAAAGAEVRHGVGVVDVTLDADDGPTLQLGGPGLTGTDGPTRLSARIVVGADGAPSRVARAAGVDRPVRLPPRVGLSHHLPDPRPDDDPVPARLRVLRDGYVGIAPVPGGRVNVGIVLGPSHAARLAAVGAAAVADDVLRDVPPTDADPTPWRDGKPCETATGASPLGTRVTRRAGPGWFLVGDAAGFLDPFTGEGLHRALVSAALAAPAIEAIVRGRSSPERGAAAYDRAMRRRFGTKDAVSWLVQAFLAHPAAFEYAARRLATRDRPRATMSLVMGDLIPAAHGLDPRFLAAVLRP